MMAAERPRRLFWFPIVHTQADLGSMGETVRRLQIQKVGSQRWEHQRKVIDELWAGIRRQVDQLDLPWECVRLYQDGLANCGKEEEIVQSLAQSGSLNHQLLRDLVARGATLVGTESPELLMEEYKLAEKLLHSMTAGRSQANARLQALSRDVLQRRDRYIAQRISETLRSGETGLLFLGTLHTLPPLPSDIEVVRQKSLIPEPPNRRSGTSATGRRQGP